MHQCLSLKIVIGQSTRLNVGAKTLSGLRHMCTSDVYD